VLDGHGQVSECSDPVAYRHDGTPPVVALSAPVDGTAPTFAGTAGTAVGDLGEVTLEVFAGESASGDPVQTLSAARAGDGRFSTAPASPLAPGRYSVRATQSDSVGHVGRSAVVAFTVLAPTPQPPPAPPSGGGGPASGGGAPPPVVEPPAAAAARASIATSRVVLRASRLKLVMRCAGRADQRCTGRLALQMKTGKKVVTVGRASYSVAGGKRVTVVVKPTSALLKMLRAKRRATVTAVARGADGGAEVERRVTVVGHSRRR
jgi:hypothetical protein